MGGEECKDAVQVLQLKGHRRLGAPGEVALATRWHWHRQGWGFLGSRLGWLGSSPGASPSALCPTWTLLQPLQCPRDELTDEPGPRPQDTEGHLLASLPPILCSAGWGCRTGLPEPLTPDLGAGWFSWDAASSVAAPTYCLTLWRGPQNCHSTNNGGQGVTGAEASMRLWDGHLWFHVRENPDLQTQVLFQFSHSHSSLTSGWGRNKPPLICRLNSLKSQLVLFFNLYFFLLLGVDTRGTKWERGTLVRWLEMPKVTIGNIRLPIHLSC